jgi:transcriptional regulator with XRE-family HTH domain
MPSAQEELGARIRVARKTAGMSQSELAEEVGLSVESVSRAERGRIVPTIFSLIRFAEVLRLDLAELVQGGTPRKSSRRRPQLERAVRLIEELDDDALLALGDFLRALQKPRRARGTSAR